MSILFFKVKTKNNSCLVLQQHNTVTIYVTPSKEIRRYIITWEKSMNKGFRLDNANEHKFIKMISWKEWPLFGRQAHGPLTHHRCLRVHRDQIKTGVILNMSFTELCWNTAVQVNCGLKKHHPTEEQVWFFHFWLFLTSYIAVEGQSLPNRSVCSLTKITHI